MEPLQTEATAEWGSSGVMQTSDGQTTHQVWQAIVQFEAAPCDFAHTSGLLVYVWCGYEYHIRHCPTWTVM